MSLKKLASFAALSLSAGLLLSACGDSGETTATTENTATSVVDTTPTAASATETSVPPAVEGDDPVFAVLDQVEEKYPGAQVIDVDFDDPSEYEIVALIDGEKVELKATTSGQIAEDDRESPDDSTLAIASQVSVSIQEAIKDALDQHPDARIDEVELEEDNGRIQWEITLINAKGQDVGVVVVPATGN